MPNEPFTKELSERLIKIEEKVQHNSVQLITLEGKIDGHVSTGDKTYRIGPKRN